MKPKRYLVFWFAQYYPSGGWNDLLDSFDSLEEAREYLKGRCKPDDLWFGDGEIIDLESGEKQ